MRYCTLLAAAASNNFSHVAAVPAPWRNDDRFSPALPFARQDVQPLLPTYEKTAQSRGEEKTAAAAIKPPQHSVLLTDWAVLLS